MYVKRIVRALYSGYIERSRWDWKVEGTEGHWSLQESVEAAFEGSFADGPRIVVPRRNPFHEGIHANVPMEISVFPRSGRLYGSFRGAPPTRKFSYVPFTRRVRRVSPSLVPCPPPPRIRPPRLAVSFSPSRRVHPRVLETSKRSFAAWDIRVNIHAPLVVAFRCIFTPESSLPRCIFIRHEWYVTSLPPIKRKRGGCRGRGGG